MNRGRHPRSAIRPCRLTGLLVVGVLVATATCTVGMSAAGYASEPSPSDGSSSQPLGTSRPSSVRNRAAGLIATPVILLTVASLDALDLTYVGTFPLPDPSNGVRVLRFTMSSGSVAGMNLAEPCTTGPSTVTVADSASFGRTTFDAVQLSGTVDGTPVTFDVADPPATAFPAEIVLRQVTLQATTISAGTLTMPASTTQAVVC